MYKVTVKFLDPKGKVLDQQSVPVELLSSNAHWVRLPGERRYRAVEAIAEVYGKKGLLRIEIAVGPPMKARLR